ncbi:hypothetical protein HKX48_001459 [Thoreauomyces humboldtii]|nr:hypothetical protein HKX48_001459 [Thoreauomyces humboldtii]
MTSEPSAAAATELPQEHVEAELQDLAVDVGGDQAQVWGGDDGRQEEVATRDHSDIPAAHGRDQDIASVAPAVEEQDHVTHLESTIAVPPVEEAVPYQEEVNAEAHVPSVATEGTTVESLPESESEDEETTLGSLARRYSETAEQLAAQTLPTTGTASDASASPLPEEPEEEPEVLPVLSIGLPARVSSLQTRRELNRSASASSISSTNLVISPVSRTDTSAPELRTTELPTFATPTPMAAVRVPVVGDLGMGNRPPPAFVSSLGSNRDYGMPLSENSKSKQFNTRLDYMVGEFFTRQVAKMATSTPESVDRIGKLFSQRVREKLGQQVGKQWAHVTQQPEVDEAAKDIESMHTYYAQLEKMVEKQRYALQQLNEVESELSLFYQQKGYQEHQEEIGRNLVHLGVSYHQETKERVPVIAALDAYLEFLKTFKSKAIADSRDTIKLQKTARQEFDSYASRLGHLEEKNVRANSTGPVHTGPAQSISSSSGTERRSSFNPLRSKATEETARYQEKELDQTRQRFQNAKTKYQTLSTQVIDKAGLLEMKREVDFGAYLARVVESHDAYGARHFEAGKVRADGFYLPADAATSTPSPVIDGDAERQKMEEEQGSR